MMLGRFSPDKTIQASAILLKEMSTRQMSFLRLLKLLYVADRDSLKETERTITRDSVLAMKNGPVLSRTYNLIKGEDYWSPEWDRYFGRIDHHSLRLIDDPGVGSLSAFEVRKLKAAAARYNSLDDWELVEELHTLPEWVKNQPVGETATANPISLDDLLAALEMSEYKEELLSDVRASEAFDALLAGVAEPCQAWKRAAVQEK